MYCKLPWLFPSCWKEAHEIFAQIVGLVSSFQQKLQEFRFLDILLNSASTPTNPWTCGPCHIATFTKKHRSHAKFVSPFSSPYRKKCHRKYHRKTKQSKQSKQTLGIQSPCQMMIGVYNHLQNAKVFRFHETILSFDETGSLGRWFNQNRMILPLPLSSP